MYSYPVTYPVTKILILLANPNDTSRLRLEAEARDIKEALKRSSNSTSFEVIYELAVTFDSLRYALTEHNPQIVHFCGHGTEDGLVLEAPLGSSDLMRTETLEQLFELFKNQIKCVVLNSCYSVVQAKSIARHVNYVIGTPSTIGDNTAQEFSCGFYHGLGGGKPIEEAYSLGRVAIRNKDLPSHLVPVLLDRGKGRDRPSPFRPVPANSRFYVNRSEVEINSYQEITNPGALIRVISPGRRWGKTSLLGWILHQAAHRFGYRTVRLSLENATFTSSTEFFQWFCSSIAYELNLEDKVAEFWEGVIPDGQKCTKYLTQYVLPQIDRPLVLGLDNAAQMFRQLEQSNCPEIAQGFFSLLRSWHEMAATPDSALQKLRLVLAYSLGNKPVLPLHTSPFNIGLAIELGEFETCQVQDLTVRYGLKWSTTQVEQLMRMVGGQPYLLQVALHYISNGSTLEKFLQIAATDTGPYKEHLQYYAAKLSEPILRTDLKNVVMSDKPIVVESAPVLRDMGLVKFHANGFLQENSVVPLCDLYRLYFCTRLGREL